MEFVGQIVVAWLAASLVLGCLLWLIFKALEARER